MKRSVSIFVVELKLFIMYLTIVTLAKDDGITIWALVDKSLPPDARPILFYCESFHNHCLTNDTNGNVQDSIVHGIASVFCPPEYRGRGYAVRRMTEMAKALRDWQSECGRTVGSILYSDIRMSFYSKLGWLPNDTKSHMVFGLLDSSNPCSANEVLLKYVEGSVKGTRRIIREAMTITAATKMRIIILPDLDHMIWQIIKEAIVTDYFFREDPKGKRINCRLTRTPSMGNLDALILRTSGLSFF
ncbi:Acyl-CoA N-acyltransferase [Macrophomina phaseolina MS6]|uniref:Acyl-CoA N-acyltransferase n=1 Tax=Macrophomina phaseolina (strain MS6) TaxID=1126212 RepID=K2QVJ6_MACPH|nr:Acyl-CoA N-acyltransferase [Macrophomina phaseolina MS6]